MERYSLDKLENNTYAIMDNTPFPTVLEVYDEFKDAKDTLEIYNRFTNNTPVFKYKLDLGYMDTECYFNSDLEARDWFFRYFRPLEFISNLSSRIEIRRYDDNRLVAFLNTKRV